MTHQPIRLQVIPEVVQGEPAAMEFRPGVSGPWPRRQVAGGTAQLDPELHAPAQQMAALKTGPINSSSRTLA